VNEVVVASASTSKDARVIAVERMYSMLEVEQNNLSASDMVCVSYLVLDFS